MKRPTAKAWELTVDMATACTPASTKPLDALFGRWPGLPLLIAHQISYLAGLATAFEEGEL